MAQSIFESVSKKVLGNNMVLLPLEHLKSLHSTVLGYDYSDFLEKTELKRSGKDRDKFRDFRVSKVELQKNHLATINQAIEKKNYFNAHGEIAIIFYKGIEESKGKFLIIDINKFKAEFKKAEKVSDKVAETK